MKRKPSYVRLVRVEPYDWSVYVFDDREKWLRFVLRRMIGSAKSLREDVNDSRGITQINDWRAEAYVGVFDGAGHTLVHEAVHVAIEILGHVGVKVKPGDNEALAYLVEHIIRECSR